MPHSPSWSQLEEKLVLGPEALHEMEQTVKIIHQNIKVAQDRQMSYGNKKIIHRELKYGDHVYLRIKNHKITFHTDGCAKLAPRYCCPFEVLERVGPLAYKLNLLSYIKAQNVFHVSFLKKCVHDATHVIEWIVIKVET